MTTGAHSINPFRVLARHRNFRLFWIGQTLSLVGSWMQSMARGWLALALTDSAFLVGLVAAAGSLPILVFSLHAGVVADRTDKLRLVKIAQSLLLLEAIALWWLAWTGHMTIHWLLALATIGGVIGAFEIPARQSLQIELVGRDDLRSAIALNSSSFNLGRVIGPVVGAFVIAQFGIAWCFGLNAVSFFTVLVGLGRIRLPEWKRQPTSASPTRDIVEGLRYVAEHADIRALIQMVAVFSILGTPYLTLMPVVARDLVRAGVGGYGMLLSAVGIGGFVGALLLAAEGGRMKGGRWLERSSIAYASLLVLVALSRSAPLTYILLLATGFTMILNNALVNGLLQALVPDAFRGRLMSLYSLIVIGLSQVVGAFLAGAIAGAAGVEWAIGSTALILLGYSVYVRRVVRRVGAA